jgi:hypothetical protein
MTTGLKGGEQVPSLVDPMRKLTLMPRMKIALLITAIVLIVMGIVGFWCFTHQTYTPSHEAAAVVALKGVDGTN